MKPPVLGVLFLMIVFSASFVGTSLSMPRLIFKIPPEKFLLCPDINNDGQVNSADLMVIRASFGTAIGSANWNGRADLNQDGIIDILDAVIVASAQKGGLFWPLT